MSGIALPHRLSGKIRELYDVDDGHILIVTSDRISAFDVVLDEPIPEKGRVLTAISTFWFDRFADVVPNHLVSTDLADLPEAARDPSLAGRAMLCRRAEMLPLECIVRGYLTGSAWKEYEQFGTMHGSALAPGLRSANQLPEPVFTPSTKAVDGHDENIDFSAAADLVGEDLANQARDICLELYSRGAAHAADCGILIADTKFELGLVDGELTVCDEALTPDSSRFWPRAGWVSGSTPPSFDKQPVRDHLAALDWDQQPPAPALPAAVVGATTARYIEAYERLSGQALADWPGA